MMSITLLDRQVQLNRADSLSFTVLLDGAAVSLSAASYTLYDADTVKATGNATVSTNSVTVSIASTVFTVPGQYRIVLNVTRSTGSTILTTQHLFWVVRYKLVPMVDDLLLQKYYPSIGSDEWPGTTNFQAQIDQAFNDVLDEIFRSGYDGAFIVDAGQLNHAVTFKALAIIFAGVMRADDVWKMRYDMAVKDYEAVMASIRFAISTDLSGVPERTTNFASIRLGR